MPVILALAVCCAIPLVIGGVMALKGLRKDKHSEDEVAGLIESKRESLDEK